MGRVWKAVLTTEHPEMPTSLGRREEVGVEGSYLLPGQT